MAERLRSMSFALFGASAMFGLLLVAIMAQSGLSLLPALPIPGLAPGGEGVSNGSVVARPVRPAASGADLAGATASPVSASVAAAGHHRLASHPASTPSPPAPGTPAGSGRKPAPVAAEPAPIAEPAPESASSPTVAPAPAATPSGESSPASSLIAAGTDTGGDSGRHGHQPSPTPPPPGHHGGSTPSPRPPGGPESLPEPEATVPTESYESSWSGHGQGHHDGYDQSHGHSGH